MRINKYLATLGIGSRRAMDDLISKQKVMVNGELAELGMQVDPDKDEISVDGAVINKQLEDVVYEYWKLNKPVGVISSASDDMKRKTVMDFVDSKARLYPVGRLDQESEGLILLTNDGQLAYRLTHPKFEVKKKYLVWINGDLNQRVISHLENGVRIADNITTAPSELEIIFREKRKAKFALTIHEGHNRQIRRMCSHAGITVTRLKRVKMGSLELGDLEEGQIKKLTESEIEALKTETDLK